MKARHIVRRGPGPAARAGLVALVAAAVFPVAVGGHEVRPAYLQLTEVAAGRFEVVWKQPILPAPEAGLSRRLPLDPAFPAHCREEARELPEATRAALIERWMLACGGRGLLNAEIAIAGLPRTLTDVLLRVRFLDGDPIDHVLQPEAPGVTLSRSARASAGLPAYFRLGTEHLLFGFDHILFVVGLMFCVRRLWQLLQIVTAFTVAHSVTLAASTLGVLTLPQQPVEAVIALSILFVAVELARGRDGERSLMARSPWLIAFGFGLLHGFGFAGALAEIGLPEQARAAALLLFNVGVEIGQLMVVGALLLCVRLAQLGSVRIPDVTRSLPIYIMGIVSAFWFVERVASLV